MLKKELFYTPKCSFLPLLHSLPLLYICQDHCIGCHKITQSGTKDVLRAQHLHNLDEYMFFGKRSNGFGISWNAKAQKGHLFDFIEPHSTVLWGRAYGK